MSKEEHDMTKLSFGLLALGASALLTLTQPVAAAEPAKGTAIFKSADLKHGEHLLQELQCAECHIRRVGGDGSAIYKPKGRISTPVKLREMVQYCSTQLNHSLFPEDVLDIAAVLQRDHYRFKD
jgi:mono/diheme cytochrome c family protein